VQGVRGDPFAGALVGFPECQREVDAGGDGALVELT